MIYLIGIPGLIPFYLCFYNIDLVFLDFDKNMFVHYSTVILSFLGAVYWGVYLHSKNNIEMTDENLIKYANVTHGKFCRL